MWKQFGLISLILSLIWSCGRYFDNGGGYESTREGRKVILTIEEKEYTNADYRRYVKVTTGQEFATLSPEALKELTHSFIEEKLLLRAAQEEGVALTSEERRNYLGSVLGDDFIETSLEENPSAALLLDKYCVEKFTAGLIQGIQVSADEINDYYQDHKRDFLRPERVRVSQILLKTQEQAVAALEKIKGAPEEIFRETARAVSVGMEAVRDGSMGVFEMGQLPLEMDEVVYQLKEGEVSRIVESTYGYHIFRLDEKLDQTLMNLEEASLEIRKRLLNRKIESHMEAYLEELKKRCDWSFYYDRLALPEQEEIL